MSDQPTTEDDTKDPYEDIENVPRSYPNRVDQSGVPDVQWDQPADALGEEQMSAESLAKEQEEFANSGGSDGTEEPPADAPAEEEDAPAPKATARRSTRK